MKLSEYPESASTYAPDLSVYTGKELAETMASALGVNEREVRMIMHSSIVWALSSNIKLEDITFSSALFK